jgi:hypothetical protein
VPGPLPTVGCDPVSAFQGRSFQASADGAGVTVSPSAARAALADGGSGGLRADDGAGPAASAARRAASSRRARRVSPPVVEGEIRCSAGGVGIILVGGWRPRVWPVVDKVSPGVELARRDYPSVSHDRRSAGGLAGASLAPAPAVGGLGDVRGEPSNHSSSTCWRGRGDSPESGRSSAQLPVVAFGATRVPQLP